MHLPGLDPDKTKGSFAELVVVLSILSRCSRSREPLSLEALFGNVLTTATRSDPDATAARWQVFLQRGCNARLASTAISHELLFATSSAGRSPATDVIVYNVNESAGPDIMFWAWRRTGERLEYKLVALQVKNRRAVTIREMLSTLHPGRQYAGMHERVEAFYELVRAHRELGQGWIRGVCNAGGFTPQLIRAVDAYCRSAAGMMSPVLLLQASLFPSQSAAWAFGASSSASRTHMVRGGRLWTTLAEIPVPRTVLRQASASVSTSPRVFGAADVHAVAHRQDGGQRSLR